MTVSLVSPDLVKCNRINLIIVSLLLSKYPLIIGLLLNGIEIEIILMTGHHIYKNIIIIWMLI